MNTINSQKIALYNQSVTNIINNYRSFIEGKPEEEKNGEKTPKIEGIKEKCAKELAQKIVDECHEDKLKVDLATILSEITTVFERGNIGCVNKLNKELYNIVYDMQRSKDNRDIIAIETRYSKRFIDSAMPSNFEYKEVNPAISDQPFFPNVKEQNTLVKKLTEVIYSKAVVANPDRFHNNNRQNIIRERQYAINSSLSLYQEIGRVVEKEIESMQEEVNNLELDYVYDRIVGAGTLLKTCVSSVISAEQSREVFNRFDEDANDKYKEILPTLSISKENLDNYKRAM